MTGIPTPAQQHELSCAGVPPEPYALLRCAGASHDDVMEAFVLGADLRFYGFLRTNRPHADALREAGATNSPERAEAARLGISEAELGDARAAAATAIDAYWAALRRGTTVRHDAPPIPRLTDYLAARRAGLAHDEARWFAGRISELPLAPAARDVEAWARCRHAGLDRAWMFSAASGRALLKGYQLETLHAGLFVVRSLEHRAISQQELVWVARRADGGRLDMQEYVQQRCRGRSARKALRLARVAVDLVARAA
ncbi:MAG: hypothetical protein AB7Q42_25460 [Acidimicrobiia bacterium]